MSRNIICADCGAPRKNPMYKNTLYCEKCRLLRNVLFIAERTYTCTYGTGKNKCRTVFAPTKRGDKYCGEHAFGANRFGRCAFCDKDNVELHRPTMPICKDCVRNPNKRAGMCRGLRTGQTDRRRTNAWSVAA